MKCRLRKSVPFRISRANAATTFLIVSALLVPRMAVAQVAYQYTGNVFQFFSCGPNSDNTATLDCSNAPAPGNTHTSYTATDHVTATLTLDAALSPNLNYQDITTLAGFKLTMNDGQQTLVSGTTGVVGTVARVSTDPAGNIVQPLLVINFGPNPPDNDIVIENHPAGSTFVTDQGVLACCDPTIPGNLALNFSAPGTWSPGSGLVGTPTYGALTRIVARDQFPGDSSDITIGDLGQTQASFTLYSTIGIQAAYPRITAITASNPAGLASGAWSEAALASGGARGLAFRNFRNITSGPLTVKLNAVFNGRFTGAPFGLPNGPTFGGAAIHVFDATKFAAGVQASGKPVAKFLLGYDFNTAVSPAAEVQNLDNLFPGALLAEGTTFLSNGPVGPISNPVSTPTFTVASGQTITVVFDVATAALVTILADGTTGGDDIYFLDTLDPSPNFFSDANGNPVTGLAAVDAPPPSALPPAPGSLSLAPATNITPVGGAVTLSATATDTTGAPLPNAIVRFSMASGPNAGASGAGTTNASGNVTFTYADNNGAGVDTIAANIGSLQSNSVQQTWQGPAKCPQPQGFWKNNPGAWPVTSLNIGAQTYTKQQLLQILASPGGADASQILALQLIAAKLNVANGADRSPVSQVIPAADTLLAGFSGMLPYNVKPSSATGGFMTQRTNTLGSFNKGALTGSCTP